ncbi:MAG: 2-oxoacid:acceptor oxidoreductase family protein [Firmicutes bacterium]|nr:2-oxoacid:acceptor oxidoreductase family protein [Bacillota bacterium]
MHTKIAVAGEGGQGVQSIGEILAEAANRSGLETTYMPNFGVEQRGGVSIAFVQISDRPIGSPKFKRADVLVVLSPRSVERTRGYVTPGTTVIYDSSSIEAPKIDDMTIGIQSWETLAPEGFADMAGNRPGKGIKGEEVRRDSNVRTVGIPAARIAKEELQPRVFNILILGAILAITKVVTVEAAREAMEHMFREKFAQRPELRDDNFAALERGLSLVETEQAGAGR